MSDPDRVPPHDEPNGASPPENCRPVPNGRVARLDAAIARGSDRVIDETQRLVLPAWRRMTEGELRWPASLAIVTAIALQIALPTEFTIGGRFILTSLEAALLVFLVVANPVRINQRARHIRVGSLALIVVVSLANAWSAAKLVRGLIEGFGIDEPRIVLGIGASIWLTNVIVFALWYWELDAGGPAARCLAERPYPDFLFPQMLDGEHRFSPREWRPLFVDYLFLSFTNATAFSPTDTLPLARWAKIAMLMQAAVSLVTVGLVIARAVNILK